MMPRTASELLRWASDSFGKFLSPFKMKNLLIAFVLLLTILPALAQKPCDELKSEIDKKLKSKGVKTYQLTVVSSENVVDQIVVGSCQGGTKKITYKRSNARDLIVDFGNGDSIRLAGQADSFRCDDPAYANVEKEQTTEGALSLCRAVKKLSVRVMDSLDKSVGNLSMNELVKLAFEQDGPRFLKEPKCGYELIPKIWELKLDGAKSEHEIVHCNVPSDYYILLLLTSSMHIEMNPGGDVCDALSRGASKDVDSLHDPDLWLDALYVSDLAPYRYSVQWCPTPVLGTGNLFAGHRANADGYVLLLSPVGEGQQRFSFSVTNPCWYDLRNHDTGDCPSKQSRRAVEMFLTMHAPAKK